ncbi:MAG: mobile mystery protein A [Alphaproteobacteria bacterium]|nr:mobile mystery protein A [Alphaproteobacteria bacterium]
MSIASEQFDRRIAGLRSLSSAAKPQGGWVRAIRHALGMTTAQLGRRLSVSQPRVIEIEKAEADGSITLKTLERAADALGCRVVYALVPERPLTERIERKALEIADLRIGAVEQTMSLTDQSVDDGKIREKIRRQLAADLLKTPARLWDEV